MGSTLTPERIRDLLRESGYSLSATRPTPTKYVPNLPILDTHPDPLYEAVGSAWAEYCSFRHGVDVSGMKGCSGGRYEWERNAAEAVSFAWFDLIDKLIPQQVERGYLPLNMPLVVQRAKDRVSDHLGYIERRVAPKAEEVGYTTRREHHGDNFRSPTEAEALHKVEEVTGFVADDSALRALAQRLWPDGESRHTYAP